MTTPIDLKVLIKQVLTDPMGLNLPTRPSTAIVSGNAVGDKGNWTGVYGHSERSLAIYGESPVFAGFFQGDVYINGHLEVTGDLTVKGHSIDELLQKIGQLEQKIHVLETTGVENQVRRLVKRLENQRFGVTVRNGGRLTVKPHNPQGILSIAGADFNPHSDVLVRVGNRLGLVGDVHFGTNANGEFDEQMNFNIQALPIYIAATDGRLDDSDFTGLGWSETVIFNN